MRLYTTVGLITSSMWQLANDRNWKGYTEAVRYAIEKSDGPIVDPKQVQRRLQEVDRPHLWRYRWAWAWPVLGMCVDNKRSISRLYRPEGYEGDFSVPTASDPFPKVPWAGFDGTGYFRFDELAGKISEEFGNGK